MTASFRKAASIAARKEIAQAMEEMRVQFMQFDARIKALEAAAAPHAVPPEVVLRLPSLPEPKRRGRPPKQR